MAELNEIHSRWREGRWIFRGQNDAGLELHPKAMRDGGFVNLFVRQHFDSVYTKLSAEKKSQMSQQQERPESLDSDDPDYSSYVDWGEFEPSYRKQIWTAVHATMELMLAYTLEQHADSVSLVVPIDRFQSDWNKPMTLEQMLDEHAQSRDFDKMWRQEPMRIIYALAQHHGLPTRLLDWTYRPYIAAFFAAFEFKHSNSGSAECQGEEQRHQEMVVWAVRQDILDSLRLQVVRHHGAQLGFLRAQDGLFVYDQLAHYRYQQHGRWIPLDEIFALSGDSGSVCKVILKHSKRCRLLELLEKKKITMAHLMPSFDNVCTEVLDNFHNLRKLYT